MNTNELNIQSNHPKKRLNDISAMLASNPELPDMVRDAAPYFSPATRQSLLKIAALGDFALKTREVADSVEATGKLSKQISQFIKEYYEVFLANDSVKIHYDNGQVEVSKLLSSVFNALLPNPMFRKVMPSDYKLFQAADFICTMELIKLKLENNLFSNSERNFFGNQRDLKQNYLKPLKRKEWK